jgi:hypothetical protein
MKIILNTLCLTIAVLLGGTRSIAEAADYPKYDGDISSIDKPLLLINRPHPSSKWSIRGTGSFSFNEEKINFEQLITGKTEVIQSGSSIVQRLEIDDFQHNLMKGQEAPDMSLIQTTLIKLTMAPSGQYKKIDVESSIHKVTNQDKDKLDRFFGVIIKALNSTYNPLPKNGILQNHAFFNINESALSIGEYIRKYNIPDEYVDAGITLSGITFNISYKGIAIGMAQYGGRQVIVIKKIGKISINKIPVENISIRNVLIKINGYALMDTYTGRWVLNETLIEGHGKLGELDLFVESRETGELHLHASTPRHKYSSKAVSTKTSLQEAKEECSELGFEKGTEKFGTCVMRLID